MKKTINLLNLILKYVEKMKTHSQEYLAKDLMPLMHGGNEEAQKILIELYEADPLSILALYALKLMPFEIVIMYSYVCFDEIHLMVKALDRAARNESFKVSLMHYIKQLCFDFERLEEHNARVDRILKELGGVEG
jgi:hypothetical protein